MDYHGQLTNLQIAQLAHIIPLPQMEEIAKNGLGLRIESIMNIKHDYLGNCEGINRAIIRAWKNQYDGNDEVMVSYFTFKIHSSGYIKSKTDSYRRI